MAQPFLDLGLIVTRLQGQVAALKHVAESMDIEAAKDDLKAIVPAAYVLPARDAVAANTLVNAVNQQVSSTFGVLLVVRNFRDATGAAARSELTPLRSAVADALLNWEPGADYGPCEYAGGRLVALLDRTLLYMDDYRTTFEIRKT